MKEFEVGQDYILNDNSKISFKVIKILEDRYEVSDLNTGFINYVSKGVEGNYTDMRTYLDNINSYLTIPRVTVNNLSEIKDPKENIRYRDKTLDSEFVYKNNEFIRVLSPFGLK